MDIEIVGWEVGMERVRNTPGLENACYVTLTERLKGSEPQIQRIDLEAPTGPDDAFRLPIVEQVFEQLEELRSVAIDQTPMGAPMNYRLHVYGPKGVDRLISVGISVHRPDPYATSSGGDASAVNSKTAVEGVNVYLSSVLKLGQQANRVSQEQLLELVRTLQRRVRELEAQLVAMVDRIVDARQTDASEQKTLVQSQNAKAMFDQLMGSVNKLGSAWLLKEAPELAGLDPQLLDAVKGMLDDPAVSKAIKDPVMLRQLQDPGFRSDFAGVLQTMVEAAQQLEAAKAAQASSPSPSPDSSPSPA